MLGMFHGHLQLLFFKFRKVHDFFLHFSLLAQPLEDYHVKLRYFFFTFAYPVFHCHQRLYDQVQLLRYLVDNFLNLRRNLILFISNLGLSLFRCVFGRRSLASSRSILRFKSICCVFQFVDTFYLRNLLIFGSIQSSDELGLLRLEVGLPYHCQRVASSSRKIVPILWKRASIGASVVTVQCVFETTSVYLPYFDLWVERSGDQIVVLGMKIDFSDWLSMSIVVLNESFAPQVVEFDLFISWARGKTGPIWVEFAIVDGSQMIVELI